MSLIERRCNTRHAAEVLLRIDTQPPSLKVKAAALPCWQHAEVLLLINTQPPSLKVNAAASLRCPRQPAAVAVLSRPRAFALTCRPHSTQTLTPAA